MGATLVLLGVDDENTCRTDDDVVDVGSRARYAPVVQDSHDWTCQAVETPAECLLPVRADGPGFCALRFIGQREHQTAKARVLGADALFAVYASTLELAAGGGARDPRWRGLGVVRGEARCR
jgi:hypothetical protein